MVVIFKLKLTLITFYTTTCKDNLKLVKYINFLKITIMNLNWLTLIAVIVIQYVIGAFWYSVVFKNQWMGINHPEGVPSKEEQARLEKEAIPYYIIQLLMTVATAAVQWYFIAMNPSNWLQTSFLIWLGFLVPAVVQTIIWSDPKNKQKILQTAIMGSNLLILTVLAGWAFATFR
jgi:Protein of unknown function (DUF1761)